MGFYEPEDSLHCVETMHSPFNMQEEECPIIHLHDPEKHSMMYILMPELLENSLKRTKRTMRTRMTRRTRRTRRIRMGLIGRSSIRTPNSQQLCMTMLQVAVL